MVLDNFCLMHYMIFCALLKRLLKCNYERKCTLRIEAIETVLNEDKTTWKVGFVGTEYNGTYKTAYKALTSLIKQEMESRKLPKEARDAHPNKGKYWMKNPATREIVRVLPKEVPDYCARGYVMGRKLFEDNDAVAESTDENSPATSSAQAGLAA